MSILHYFTPLPKIDLSILRLMVKVFRRTLAYLSVTRDKLLPVGQAFRNCLKSHDFIMASAGAVREPPEIRALLEAPLHKISGMA
jgi:hypothetical protein